MRLRKRYLPFVALLGAAAALIPSMASSANTPMTATVSGTEAITWSPMEVAIAPGGTVTFEDPSKTVAHGVVWKSGPETPVCSGVPINEGRKHWKGTCTFTREGTYRYYCFVHGEMMSGVVAVANTAPTPTNTTSTTPTQPGTSMPGMTMTGGEAPPSQGGGAGTTGGSSGAGTKDTLGSGVLSLALRQRGSVRGSLVVAQASSRLVIELIAPADEIGHSRQAHGTLLAGRLLEAHLPAGHVQFRVPLTVAARSALARLGRLSLTVRIRLTPPAGAAITRTLHVALRR